MGFSVTQRFDEGAIEHIVMVSVTLTMAETNSLFLSGDTIISWPEGDLRVHDDSAPTGSYQAEGQTVARTGMFVSELARLAHGLEIGYRQTREAERAVTLIRLQLLRAGLQEVG